MLRGKAFNHGFPESIWQAAKDLKHHDEEIRLDAVEYITGPNYAHDCDLLFGRYLPLEELI